MALVRYGKRVKGALVGAIVGMVMFPASFCLLAWSEWDAVRQTGAITEIAEVAIPDVPSSLVDSRLEGQLVHVRGTALTDDVLVSSRLPIRANAIRLRWDASIYQWEEDERNRDDRKVYEYEKKWVGHVIDSDRFHDTSHSNQGSKQHFHDGREQATQVRLGAFALSDPLVEQIGNEQPMAIPQEVLSDIQPPGTLYNGVFYTGDPTSPQIGDEKVEVFVVEPRQDVTVLSTQADSSFRPYSTKVGIAKNLLYMGLLSKDQVIEKQHMEAAIRRWMIRAGGFLAMWLGLTLVLNPIRAILQPIPLLGRVVSGALGVATLLITTILSSITIAIFWIVVRPVLSVLLLVLAAIGIYLLLRNKETSLAIPTGAVPPPLPGQ